MESTGIKLPPTFEDLVTCLRNDGILGPITSQNPLNQLAKKYSVPGLFNGRPFDQVLIVLAGASGTGKSSTINTLFEDDELCKVSASESETSDVTFITKELHIEIEKLMLIANLTFVDVPGSLDTDSSKESKNFSKVVNFRENYPALKRRRVPESLAYPGLRSLMNAYNVKEKVYPNLVLFVFNASDKRLKGPDTSLIKSLKLLKEQDLVDVHKPNLILVGTHAANISRLEDEYTEIVETMKDLVKQGVQQIFPNIHNVPVVFVENKSLSQGLQKDGDFYKLPNGELSHSNLFTEMTKLFGRHLETSSDEDRLALKLTAHYFKSNCPEKSTKPSVDLQKYFSENEIANEDEEGNVNNLLRQLNIVSKIDEVITHYKLQFLGHGYCPLTKSIKLHYLFDKKSGTDIVNIGKNAKYHFPIFIKHFNNVTSQFQILNDETKEKHESSKLNLETLEKLSINDEFPLNKVGKGTISILYEKSVSSLQIDNPEEYISPKFSTELQNLPDKYDKDTAEIFNDFFHKFGTHFVAKVSLGGWMRLDCEMEEDKCNLENRFRIEETFRNSFKTNPNGDLGLENIDLEGFGVLRKQFTFGRCDSAEFSNVSNDEFKNWLKSMESHPIELEHSIHSTTSLYPFYRLSQVQNADALKAATIDYLRGKLKVKQKVLTTRDSLAKAAEDAANAEDGSCFPGSTIVTTKQGPKRMDELELDEKILTISSDLKSTKWTKFYGFAHKETEKRVEFVHFIFEGKRELIVTGDHLIFIAVLKNGGYKRVPKLAKDVGEGEQVITCCKDGGIKIKSVLKKSMVTYQGIYAPLTTTGDFLADGVLVSCYADIENFQLAHAAFAPLRMWAGIKGKFQPGKRIEEMEGIHKYAGVLMKIREFFI